MSNVNAIDNVSNTLGGLGQADIGQPHMSHASLRLQFRHLIYDCHAEWTFLKWCPHKPCQGQHIVIVNDNILLNMLVDDGRHCLI